MAWLKDIFEKDSEKIKVFKVINKDLVEQIQLLKTLDEKIDLIIQLIKKYDEEWYKGKLNTLNKIANQIYHILKKNKSLIKDTKENLEKLILEANDSKKFEIHRKKLLKKFNKENRYTTYNRAFYFENDLKFLKSILDLLPTNLFKTWSYFLKEDKGKFKLIHDKLPEFLEMISNYKTKELEFVKDEHKKSIKEELEEINKIYMKLIIDSEVKEKSKNIEKAKKIVRTHEEIARDDNIYFHYTDIKDLVSILRNGLIGAGTYLRVYKINKITLAFFKKHPSCIFLFSKYGCYKHAIDLLKHPEKYKGKSHDYNLGNLPWLSKKNREELFQIKDPQKEEDVDNIMKLSKKKKIRVDEGLCSWYEMDKS